MNFPNDSQPGSALRKRRRDDSEPSTPIPVTKKRKENAAFASYPTPESTQLSSTDSSSEESGQPCLQDSSIPEQGLSSGPHRNDARSKAAAANAARIKFLGDLDNYVPLGSLTLRLNIGEEEYLHETEWIDATIDCRVWLAFRDHYTANDAGPALSARKLTESGFARVLGRKHQKAKGFATIKVYVLPDDVGRRLVDRHDSKGTSKIRSHLQHLVNELDVSCESWEGLNDPDAESRSYETAAKDDDSLFYLFNTLPSPKPDSISVRCPVSNDAIRSVLRSLQIAGLNTRLYPYQKRTVAKMIQREVEPQRALDPRFQPLEGPTGQVFFYDEVTGILLREGRRYEEACGGILGESMGLGKTLICLATILATRGHWPEIPPEYSTDRHPVRQKVGSLMQMAAAAVGRTQTPWRALLQDASQAGEDHRNLAAMLEDNIGSYTISPPEAKYSRRSSATPKGKTIRLSTATLVIVPQNLLSQWRNEISTHIEVECLNILYLELKDEIPIPPADALLQYDIILMSRPRFEKEMVPGQKAKVSSKNKKAMGGCLCSLDKDCHCSRSDEYQSPLKEIHWLRIIMDEGHEFSSSGRSGTAYWALRNLRVDRKWIVSGTPASGLLGVEVGTATNETSDSFADGYTTSNRNLLEIRRKESALSQERKDLERLGVLVTGFLQIKPWANNKEEDQASWQKYIMPHRDGRRKAKSLKKLLESLVVRHRIEDIEADIQLPPLHNRVVHLEPSWHDKLSINLFLLNLTANAVASERVDEDYMFHPKNRRQLNILINNLRQAGFYWTGIPPEQINKVLKVSRAYLEEHQGKTSGCSEADRILLEKAMGIGEIILGSASWRSFADLHEMGVYVANFPEKARSAWSLIPVHEGKLLLTGATQLAKAQEWVDHHLYVTDPSSGLADLGLSTMQKLWQAAEHNGDVGIPKDVILTEQPRRGSSSKPKSTVAKVPRLTNERTVSRAKAAPVSPKPKKAAYLQQTCTLPEISKPTSEAPAVKSAMKSAMKSSMVTTSEHLLPPDSPLGQSKLHGTASAKLSYLLDRVTVLHQNEKILIFYEGDQIAWYIAQALDLIDVRYLIYTKTLSLARQTAYIATFNETETFRVLLMNVHQAAHGLHIASASRVFFVNPVWQPNVEAQAIKRAHRIGQTRQVYVETLVLKDTLEDQMLQRRKGMTAQEHQKAERSLLDDDIMSSIIKQANFIPLLDEEMHDESKQMAKLETPHQIFARINRGEGVVDDPDADLIFPEALPLSKAQKKKSGRGSVLTTIDKPSLSSPHAAPNTHSRRQANSVRFEPIPSITDQDEEQGPGSPTRKRQSPSEYAEEFNEQPTSTTISTPIGEAHGTIDGTSRDSKASPAPANSPWPQGSPSSSSTTQRKIKRVGFVLDTTDPTTDDEPASLFGSAHPIESSRAENSNIDGPHGRFP